MDAEGNIFTAAPGGVAIVSADGSHLGTIDSGGAPVVDVEVGGDGHLYMAALHAIMRIKVSASSAGRQK